MNNNERPVDDNSTVSISDNPKLSSEETKQVKPKKKGITIRELTIIGLLAGITIALGLSGYGIIPLGPLNVTTLHVPTLIGGAIVEGPKVGAFVGGLFSAAIVCGRILRPRISYLLYFLILLFPSCPPVLFSLYWHTWYIFYYGRPPLKVRVSSLLHLWEPCSIRLW